MRKGDSICLLSLSIALTTSTARRDPLLRRSDRIMNSPRKDFWIAVIFLGCGLIALFLVLKFS